MESRSGQDATTIQALNLTALPEEVLLKIAAYLGWFDLRSWKGTSVKLAEIGNDRTLQLPHHPCSMGDILNYTRSMPTLLEQLIKRVVRDASQLQDQLLTLLSASSLRSSAQETTQNIKAACQKELLTLSDVNLFICELNGCLHNIEKTKNTTLKGLKARFGEKISALKIALINAIKVGNYISQLKSNVFYGLVAVDLESDADASRHGSIIEILRRAHGYYSINEAAVAKNELTQLYVRTHASLRHLNPESAIKQAVFQQHLEEISNLSDKVNYLKKYLDELSHQYRQKLLQLYPGLSEGECEEKLSKQIEASKPESLEFTHIPFAYPEDPAWQTLFPSVVNWMHAAINQLTHLSLQREAELINEHFFYGIKTALSPLSVTQRREIVEKGISPFNKEKIELAMLADIEERQSNQDDQSVSCRENIRYFLLRHIVQEFAYYLKFETKQLFWECLVVTKADHDGVISNANLREEKLNWYKSCYQLDEDPMQNHILMTEILEKMGRLVKHPHKLCDTIDRLVAHHLNERLGLRQIKEGHEKGTLGSSLDYKTLYIEKWSLQLQVCMGRLKNQIRQAEEVIESRDQQSIYYPLIQHIINYLSENVVFSLSNLRDKQQKLKVENDVKPTFESELSQNILRSEQPSFFATKATFFRHELIKRFSFSKPERAHKLAHAEKSYFLLSNSLKSHATAEFKQPHANNFILEDRIARPQEQIKISRFKPRASQSDN